jgi:hypothetical protein
MSGKLYTSFLHVFPRERMVLYKIPENRGQMARIIMGKGW